MSVETVFSNARMVLGNEVVHGSVKIVDDWITSIDMGNTSIANSIDLQGQYLLPGLVELHTDNLEKHMSPRPSVNWPTLSAMISHDNQVASAGITTVFDAISIGDISPKSARLESLKPMLDTIEYTQKNALTRVEHKVHLRCEVAHPETLAIFHDCITNPHVGLVSLMDHSPGQRQFQAIEHYRTYYQGKYGLSLEQMQAFETRQVDNAKAYSHKHRLSIADYCRQNKMVMASHDDATVEHVHESYDLGMKIAEFPTTEEAARHSTDKNMQVLMGAPNVVRGGSHSGNIAASTLAKQGLLHILSSDYYPSSLLHAAFLLTQEDIAYDLPNAIATVSKNPANAVGLMDRGEIAIGKRADLLQVKLHQKQPLVQSVWKNGRRVM